MTVMKPFLKYLMWVCMVLCVWVQSVHAQTSSDADFDGSGVVDFADFLIFATAFNTSQSRCDLDKDGMVWFRDFWIFIDVFGQKTWQEIIAFQMVLPADHALKIEELRVVTPVVSVAPVSSGHTDVTTMKGSKPQVMIVENAQGKPVLLSYVMPADGSSKSGVFSKRTANHVVEISSTTTAIALVMMNPILAGSSSQQRAQIVEKATAHAHFSAFVSAIDSRLKSDPNGVLDGLGSEILYETATAILIDVLKAGVPAGKDVRTGNTGDPWIADGDGNDIIFVNPNGIYYGTGIAQRGSRAFLATKLLMARRTSFDPLRWPFMTFADESRDSLSVSDGEYSVVMSKGGHYPFSRMTDLNDPVGQATLLNFAQMIYNTLDVVLSMPIVDVGELAVDLKKLHLDLNEKELADIGVAIDQKDVTTLMVKMTDLIVANRKNIAGWLWQASAKPDNIENYIGKLLPLLKHVVVSIKTRGVENNVPFFYELVNAPKEVFYSIVMVNGVLNFYKAPNGGSTPGEIITVTLTGATTMDFVYVAPGTFLMGSSIREVGRDEDEGPQHLVTISTGFYLGKYEVTQAQWEAVIGSNPSSFKSANKPVENVSWFEAQNFVQKLNAAAGDSLYRLPTEAEWEYACRVGTTTRWSFGEDENKLQTYAWYLENNDPSGTKEVGLKLPNPWGLYDMHGNVWEWCQDWYGPYDKNAQTDPTGLSVGSSRVIRGGAFYNSAPILRSASRHAFAPSFRSLNIGLRLVRRER